MSEIVPQPKTPGISVVKYVRKASLFKQILNMRMADGEYIQRYFCHFTSVVEKFSETEVAIQEELFVIMLLACCSP